MSKLFSKTNGGGVNQRPSNPPPRPSYTDYNQPPQQPSPPQRQPGYDRPPGGGYPDPYQQRRERYDPPMKDRYRDTPDPPAPPRYSDAQSRSYDAPHMEEAQRYAGNGGKKSLRLLIQKDGISRMQQALANVVLLHPDDFRALNLGRGRDYVMIDDRVVFQAASLENWNRTDLKPVSHAGEREEGFARPGNIYLTGPQKGWAGLGYRAEGWEVAAYSPGPTDQYLAHIELEAIFPQRNPGSLGQRSIEYDAGTIAKHLKQEFRGQFLSPEMTLLIQHPETDTTISLTVVSIAFHRKGDSEGASEAFEAIVEPEARGLLDKNTELEIYSGQPTQPREAAILGLERSRTAGTILMPNFSFNNMGIGGLDTEFGAIFRRAFASRTFPPSMVTKLGIDHVKGMLLYGPPGTGKTLIARQIGKMLKAESVNIINGPEVLNKYVGQSEENIRSNFAEAQKAWDPYLKILQDVKALRATPPPKRRIDEEAYQKAMLDAEALERKAVLMKEKMGLHIIIFDELDAVCKQRGSGAGGGTGVGDSVVNQLLTKLDGVDQMDNFLMIGMTNRKDMIDEALLRPGRLEVHVEISLPDEHGRVQILKIHTAKIRSNEAMDPDVDIMELARLTKNYSGAELNGLVKAASSYAFTRHINMGDEGGDEGGDGKGVTIKVDAGELKITRNDFMHALDEVKPQFGVAEEDLQERINRGMIRFSDNVKTILSNGASFVQQVKNPDSVTSMLSVLLRGSAGTGKTALAAKIALTSDAPFIKLISPADMVGFNEMQKVQQFDKVFRDAYRSPFSVVVIDNIELLLDWVPIGPRFSNTCLVALKALLERQPPKGHRLIVFATTSESSVMTQLGMRFNENIDVPTVNTVAELEKIMRESISFANETEMRTGLDHIKKHLSSLPRAGYSDVGTENHASIGVGVKDILLAIERASTNDYDDPITAFVEDMKSKITDANA